MRDTHRINVSTWVLSPRNFVGVLDDDDDDDDDTFDGHEITDRP